MPITYRTDKSLNKEYLLKKYKNICVQSLSTIKILRIAVNFFESISEDLAPEKYKKKMK